ncbi:hypothetical protein A7K99_19640 [Tatumella citrea]|uniref:Uncharacterized protein n=1 Tax=Tatumella citrea TaxID=53336 RepID=A0A1Y0LCW4_TATCI|nr:hypothetical protein A7K98_19655 [Tatumella citrea]ARU99777.1 hypothetical protein A7K99_19640 [Tatumella citrea]
MFLVQKGQIKVIHSLFFGLKLVEYSKKPPNLRCHLSAKTPHRKLSTFRQHNRAKSGSFMIEGHKTAANMVRLLLQK